MIYWTSLIENPPPTHTSSPASATGPAPPRGADICWIPEACTVGKGAVRILLVCFLLLTFSNRDINIKINTRMHSSRMRTVRSSSHVYPSMHLAGGVYPSMRGGVCPGGVYPSMHWAGCVYPSMQGGSAQGVCIPACRGGSAQGVCIPACTGQRVCIPACRGGLPRGCVSQHALGQTTPREQNDRQM